MKTTYYIEFQSAPRVKTRGDCAFFN